MAVDQPLKLSYSRGELHLSRLPFPDFKALNVHAHKYRDLILELRRNEIPYEDSAAQYERLNLQLVQAIEPRPHQTKALYAWETSQRHGVVCLPTGAGKTILAVLAIAKAKRSTLIVVPTLELVRQWRLVLQKYFACDIGQLGGGVVEVRSLTVATYDSALIHADSFGDQFGMLVCDECHHLASQASQRIGTAYLAPFRLGLSATPERSDGGEELMYDLLGPLVYSEKVRNLSQNNVLAPYLTKVIQVELTSEERQRYELYREVFLNFIRRHNLKMGGPGGFQAFLQRASRMPGGREALSAFRFQKTIYQQAAQKMEVTCQLIQRHFKDRIIIFTDDNTQAYAIARQFILPVISHLTCEQERSEILRAFSEGRFKVIVTSKVLNEGVDVPQANIAIVYSGSSAVREHVQRLGRILRHQPGKEALLYELVAADTKEIETHKKRRGHDAYKNYKP